MPTVQGNQNNLANAGEVKNPILAAVLNYFVFAIGGYIYLGVWKKGLVVWGVYLGGAFVLGIVGGDSKS